MEATAGGSVFFTCSLGPVRAWYDSAIHGARVRLAIGELYSTSRRFRGDDQGDA
jgi:hypothetical protein